MSLGIISSGPEVFLLKNKKKQIILPLYTTTLDLKSHKIDVNLQACSSNGLTKV